MYTHRIFHDFTSLKPDLYTNELPITTEEPSAPVQPGYLTSNTFTKDWAIQTWGTPAGKDSPLPKQYSTQNVYIRTYPYVFKIVYTDNPEHKRQLNPPRPPLPPHR